MFCGDDEDKISIPRSIKEAAEKHQIKVLRKDFISESLMHGSMKSRADYEIALETSFIFQDNSVDSNDTSGEIDDKSASISENAETSNLEEKKSEDDEVQEFKTPKQVNKQEKIDITRKVFIQSQEIAKGSKSSSASSKKKKADGKIDIGNEKKGKVSNKKTKTLQEIMSDGSESFQANEKEKEKMEIEVIPDSIPPISPPKQTKNAKTAKDDSIIFISQSQKELKQEYLLQKQQLLSYSNVNSPSSPPRSGSRKRIIVVEMQSVLKRPFFVDLSDCKSLDDVKKWIETALLQQKGIFLPIHDQYSIIQKISGIEGKIILFSFFSEF